VYAQKRIQTIDKRKLERLCWVRNNPVINTKNDTALEDGLDAEPIMTNAFKQAVSGGGTVAPNEGSPAEPQGQTGTDPFEDLTSQAPEFCKARGEG
jgi:hypothetical protein